MHPMKPTRFGLLGTMSSFVARLPSQLTERGVSPYSDCYAKGAGPKPGCNGQLVGATISTKLVVGDVFMTI